MLKIKRPFDDFAVPSGLECFRPFAFPVGQMRHNFHAQPPMATPLQEQNIYGSQSMMHEDFRGNDNEAKRRRFFEGESQPQEQDNLPKLDSPFNNVRMPEIQPGLRNSRETLVNLS
jgi:hypothetical protein